MLDELKKLWQYRELLFSIVSRELKVRYKNSFLGFFWSLVNPLLTVLVFTYVFKSQFMDQEHKVGNVTAYILAAYLPYMFFSMAIMDATSSVTGNLGLVKKVYFPREILPIATIISNFVHFLLALGVFFVYLLVVYLLHPQIIPFQWTTVYLPVLLLINFCLTAGLGLMFSALNTFYEDVKYIVGFVMTMLLFLSPIMYFTEKSYYQPDHTTYVLSNLLNPVGILCNAYRKILLAPQPVWLPGDHGKLVEHPALPIQWHYIGYCAVLSVVILIVGYKVFNNYKWKFVERP